MTKDYCEKCGVKLTEANRSKAYRNRCKRCVANYEREKRLRRKESYSISKENRTLLLADICARLPYGVFVEDRCELDYAIYTTDYHPYLDTCKPYLRPLNTITTEEDAERINLGIWFASSYNGYEVLRGIENDAARGMDWLNAHYFDYRGLIKMGLALEAPKGMYDIK